MPSWGTATLVEILWTLCAFVGIGATGVGLAQAWRDAWRLLEWPDTPHPGWHRAPRTWAAAVRRTWRRRPRQLWRMGLVFIRYESALFFVCAVFAGAGVRAMGAPPVNPTVPIDWGVAVLGAAFLLACVLVTVVSVQNRLARRANDHERKRP